MSVFLICRYCQARAAAKQQGGPQNGAAGIAGGGDGGYRLHGGGGRGLHRGLCGPAGLLRSLRRGGGLRRRGCRRRRGGLGQLGRHGVGLGDFRFCRSIGEILLAAVAVPIRNVAFRCSGSGLCVNVFQVGVVVRVKAAVAFFANLTDGLSLAGRFAAGAVDRLYGVAGAVAAVGAVAVRCPVPIVVMGVALSIEHRQGLASCGQIFAFVCPRVSIVVAFASLEQLPHRAVGKFCGGLGLCFCNVAIIALANCVQIRTGKIVAVFYSANIIANDFANSITIMEHFNRSNIVAIGDRAHVKSRNTASFNNCAGNCANIIAVDDSRIVNITASNTANKIATAASNAAIVAAIFNRRSIQ